MILNILIRVKKNCASVATLKSRASRRFSRALRSSQNDDLARRSMLPSSWDVSSARVIAMFYNRLCGFDGRTPPRPQGNVGQGAQALPASIRSVARRRRTVEMAHDLRHGLQDLQMATLRRE
jgi:hypothetical protein